MKGDTPTQSLVGRFLGPLLYWLDGFGPDGRPSNTKMAALVSFHFGLACQIWFMLHGAPYSFQLAWTSLTFVAPYGLKGMMAWLGKKNDSSST